MESFPYCHSGRSFATDRIYCPPCVKEGWRNLLRRGDCFFTLSLVILSEAQRSRRISYSNPSHNFCLRQKTSLLQESKNFTCKANFTATLSFWNGMQWSDRILSTFCHRQKISHLPKANISQNRRFYITCNANITAKPISLRSKLQARQGA